MKEDGGFKRIIIWIIIIYLLIGAAYYYFYSKNMMHILTWSLEIYSWFK
ncbi:hypothetical protein KY345_00770 [Candidatus Woesearchaeota archaeon]|nr:hypothetical protein [Candidatus Woesearchaeota archaeon]